MKKSFSYDTKNLKCLQNTEQKRIKIYQAYINFFKTDSPNIKMYTLANLEAIWPIRFLNGQKYRSSTIYCFKLLLQNLSKN